MKVRDTFSGQDLHDPRIWPTSDLRRLLEMMEKGETMEKATPLVLATVRSELAYRAIAARATDRAALHRALDAALDARGRP